MTDQFKIRLDNVAYNLRQQLAFIDFSLMFKGHVGQDDLKNRFEIDASTARDCLKSYQEIAPCNMYFENKSERYFQDERFDAIVNYEPRKTLVKLANQISDGFDAVNNVDFSVEQPSHINVPGIEIIAKLVQAIVNGNVVNLIYTSLSSGSTARDVVPHSIVDNGLRWHLRAFDRNSKSFRDFVLTRISKVSIRSNLVNPKELVFADNSWQQKLTLELISHPKNVKFPTAIEMDYGMVDGVKLIEVRAAMAGYLLRRWNVDCTEDASLAGPQYQLYLRNRDSLTVHDELKIAPGIVSNVKA